MQLCIFLVKKPLSLDSFLSKYTSEDNASFEVILKENEKKNRLKNEWLYNEEQQREKVLAVMDFNFLYFIILNFFLLHILFILHILILFIVLLVGIQIPIKLKLLLTVRSIAYMI